MTLLSLKEIVGCDDYYIDDKTLQIWSFKQKKYEHGKILKPHYSKNDYIQYRFSVNGKYKYIYYHHIIVKMFIKKDFNSKIEEIDHKNHDNNDNSIDNLCVVSRSENQRNISRFRGKQYNFVDNIGKSLVINEDCGIYYSLEYDKFYMFINHTNQYKELHEYLHNSHYCVGYKYNNKVYEINIKKFKKNLNKQSE